jgi:hypothetical protein
MRKILFSLLLATTVATPALAERPGHGDRAAAREERQADRSEARPQRSEARQDRSEVREQRSQARDERPMFREQRMEAPQQSMGAQQNEAPVREIVRERLVRQQRQANVNERGRPTLGDEQVGSDSVRDWRQRQRDVVQQQIDRRQQSREVIQQQVEQRAQRGDVRQQRIEQRVERTRFRPPVGARPDRPAPAPETAVRDTHHSRWRTDWRHDRRYDWRDHRRHHRSIFHLGIYFDPFGWGYHRYGIGWRLWPSYYSSNYWLTDPYMYRLPYAPWPYKWVRYYDDALLVNTYTGQVVDVIYDFFW